MRIEQSRRVYRSRWKRTPSAAKAAIAAARPRDARGHFLPVVDDPVWLALVKGSFVIHHTGAGW